MTGEEFTMTGTTTTIVGWIIFLAKCGTVVLSAVITFWALGKWVKKSSRKQEHEHGTEMVTDILDTFGISDAGRKDALSALCSAIARGSGDLPSGLSSIFRIECVYESNETSSRKYARKLMVYYMSESGNEKIKTIARDYQWAELPPSVRGVFIRERGKRVVVLLYKKEGVKQ